MLNKLIRELILITPYGKKHRLLEFVKKEVLRFNWNDNYHDSAENFDQLIILVNEAYDKIYANKFKKCNPIELNSEDIYFLENSIKSWDKIDYIFLFTLVIVEYLLITQHFDAKRIESYNDKHDKQSGYIKQDIKYKNKYHKNMPGDTIPEAHLGGDFSGKFRIVGKVKESGVTLNHRLLFGHDLLKVNEIFDATKNINNSIPLMGSKTFGKISKTFWHLWYDTYSETGIPVPGSTCFVEFITKYLVESNDEFIKYFTIHHEDFLLQLDMSTIIELYFKTRKKINVKSEGDINLLLKAKHRKTFKEYEMKIIAYMICLSLQFSTDNNFRGKFNHVINSKIIYNFAKYINLNKKWKKKYSRALKYELNKFESSYKAHQVFMEELHDKNTIK